MMPGSSDGESSKTRSSTSSGGTIHREYDNSKDFYPINLEAVADLSLYYRLSQKKAAPCRINRATNWNSFYDMILYNLLTVPGTKSEKNDFFTDRGFSWVESGKQGVDEVMRFVTTAAVEILKDKGIHVTFSQLPGIEQIGKPSMSLFTNISPCHRPLLVGLHYIYEHYPMISTDVCFNMHIEDCENDSRKFSDDYPSYISRIRELYSHMLLNNLRYGYISTGSFTRFIRRTEIESCIEISPAIPLQASKPYTIAEIFAAVSRQCIVGDFGDTNIRNDYYLEHEQNTFEFQPETLPEPDIFSLKKRDPTIPGKTKWWRVKRQRDIIFRLKFLKPNQPLPLNSEQPYKWGISFGVITMIPPVPISPESPGTGLPLDITCPAVLKCCNYKAEESPERLCALAREASMYEYLEWCKIESVPRRYIYGDVLGFLKILALEPVGRSIRPSDINGAVIDKMKAATSELHRHKILHHDIRLSNYCIDDDKRIRIIGFSKAKRYHNLYDIAIQHEMNALEDIITEGLAAASEVSE
ncbi:hypothetical protein AWJ20_2619 [Sugiyamaella lignohabitans]|uniref:non-specific serine/threonine protein kinase n=1 Tax=Sugiyamaella lignohabitans TaxID=796027 RepID=A0A161HGS4_9ASCO|nr:uncharacterized protein AWJ20_2619 [Sugiyamaella lignohabitans]ANB15000.1 hypothetical protein AWJ20_2619 [Sugiyamaella lignohabitans]